MSSRYNLLNFVEESSKGHYGAMRFQWALYELFVLKMEREEGVISRQLDDQQWNHLIVMDNGGAGPASMALVDAFERSRRGRVEFRMNRRSHKAGDTGYRGSSRFMIVELTVFFYVRGKTPIASARYVFSENFGHCMDARFQS